MTSRYHAKPPLLLGRGPSHSWWQQVRRLLLSFLRIIWYSITPFNPRVEPPDDPPTTATKIDDEQLAECQAIFDRTERARDQLENKARATFAFLAFLTPFLVSVAAYTIELSTTYSIMQRLVIVALCLAAALMVLSLISIIRAVSVQVREVPFIDAVIDTDKETVRTYDRQFRTRGLLYCASVNSAMNAHVGQFVKGAHILSGCAIILFVLVLIPTGLFYSIDNTVESPQQINGTVAIESDELIGILRQLESTVARASNREAATAARIEDLSNRVFAVESKTAEAVNDPVAITGEGEPAIPK